MVEKEANCCGVFYSKNLIYNVLAFCSAGSNIIVVLEWKLE
jgi:hypothetical protein